MHCAVCKHGESRPGRVSVTLEREGATLVFRAVPAMVCDQCGEVYHDDVVSSQLMHRAEEAVCALVQVGATRMGNLSIKKHIR
ncbi:MAG: type II toxin-antitoxin system MqsA family antitoxin [Magnetococcales bacterium]|nr:type II toxin-antitoxin system MqsA family antitoxin [Magnetococcales bacterium]MBF0115691.1 type II toxin-antitoxin system MqsA family antitoxin [Magnetococcales bacterium]